jgi:predicted HicB family RNase H-like nuclease
MRHYSDFFTVAEDYCPVMTREEINKTADRWLDFYPHTEFEDICKTLLNVLGTGAKSVWITGNYGTGKSNATLVIQKLFMDDESRVHEWLNRHADNGLSDQDSLKKLLFDRRGEGTLVVYDFNASGVGSDDGLLVRLEKGIIAALQECNMSVPAMSNLEMVIDRVRREGANFFNTRDSIQSQLAYLDSSIKTADQLVEALNSPSAPSKLLDDVEAVLHRDFIYLDFDVPMFRKWIKAVLDANGLKRVVYLFDEFHPFIEANKEQLKTFEDVTESPGVNSFFLVPVTHMDIKAYLAEGSDSAKKANDRFYFRRLQMPNDTAFRLARHAMVDVNDASLLDEWKKAKDDLWDSVSSLVFKFTGADDPDRHRFYDILPIHPMAAFLLKHLSEQAKSNQRSFFEYLKGGADGTEFQDFIRAGGPDVANKQFLTVDYLWHYFIDRNDLGLDNEIAGIGAFYKQTRDRVFQNQTEDAPELRVLKAVLLFCLLDKLAPGGHDRLKPTVENIELSFKGDGTIADSRGIVEELEKKHCFSVTNGNISLFSMSTVKAEDIEKYRDKFHELLHEKAETKLEEHTKSYRKYSSGRFDIRVSDASHTTLMNIVQATRDKYTTGINKDDGSVCLWFVFAKDHDEQLQIPQKIEGILRQLNDHRILMFTFPQLAFCHSNKNLWEEYIRQYAQYMTENDSAAKNQIRTALDGIENDWFKEIQKHDAVIRLWRYRNGQVEKEETSWNQFKELITNYVRKTMKFNIDHLGFQDPHFGISSLAGYAEAGIMFNATSGPIGQLVSTLKKNGVTEDPSWFAQNPDHPLGAIHTLFEKKFSNTVGRGGQQSLRVVYLELKRAPYGLRYNALSAFVLGFCLRDILQKNYQWTNGQMTQPLDAKALKEIIEAVIKDDGGNRMGSKERLICRLSKEEKKFIEKAPIIFGAQPIADATVESVLGQIQSRVEAISARVPLWVLPEYVRAAGDQKADEIETVLNDVCTAFTTSSKGKVEDRVNAVKEAGEIIISDPDIVSAIAEYIKTENFVKAFEMYVDKENPALSDLATSIGDVSHGYCSSILNRCQETAGWLWKQADISREIDDMACEYEVIALAKPLCGFSEFVPYRNVFSALKTATTETNHLPKAIIESVYPILSGFLSALQSNGAVEDIKQALEQSSDIIKRLFFDHTKSEAMSILKSRLNDSVIEDADLLSILNSMLGGFGLDETTFMDNLRVKIEELAKQSVVLKIKDEWKRISGASSPTEWATNNCMPAKYIFGNVPDVSDLLKAIEHPDTFAAVKLAEILEVLKSINGASIEACQNALKAAMIPARYRKFDISLTSLLDYMRETFGKQPNGWPSHPDIDAFIKSQYKSAIAPQIKEKLRDKNAEDLKQRLLKLADDNPELGLLFWEG